MTDEQYETVYKDALRVISAVDIGEPYFIDGKRYVFINGLPCSDRVVLERAFGSRLAAEILSRQSGCLAAATEDASDERDQG
jgi:hypothetical protein